jgi:hypothetical protein
MVTDLLPRVRTLLARRHVPTGLPGTLVSACQPCCALALADLAARRQITVCKTSGKRPLLRAGSHLVWIVLARMNRLPCRMARERLLPYEPTVVTRCVPVGASDPQWTVGYAAQMSGSDAERTAAYTTLAHQLRTKSGRARCKPAANGNATSPGECCFIPSIRRRSVDNVGTLRCRFRRPSCAICGLGGHMAA